MAEQSEEVFGLGENMTVYEAYNVLYKAISDGHSSKELKYCLQTLGEHRHLKVAGIKLRDKSEVEHAEVDEVLLEIV